MDIRTKTNAMLISGIGIRTVTSSGITLVTISSASEELGALSCEDGDKEEVVGRTLEKESE